MLWFISLLEKDVSPHLDLPPLSFLPLISRGPLLCDRVTCSRSVRTERDIGSLGAVLPAYVCKNHNC